MPDCRMVWAARFRSRLLGGSGKDLPVDLLARGCVADWLAIAQSGRRCSGMARAPVGRGIENDSMRLVESGGRAYNGALVLRLVSGQGPGAPEGPVSWKAQILGGGR